MRSRLLIATLAVAGVLFCMWLGATTSTFGQSSGQRRPGATASAATKPSARELLAKWGISETPDGKYLNIWLPNSQTKILIDRSEEKCDSTSVYYAYRPIFSFFSKGPFGTPSSEYYGGMDLGDGTTKPSGTAWRDFNTDGRFDAKLEAGKGPGSYIWYGNAWLPTIGDPIKGVKDSQGNAYRFDVVKGAWVRDSR